MLAIASIRMVLGHRAIDNGVKCSLELHLEVLEKKLAALYGVIKRQKRQQAAMGRNFGTVIKKKEVILLLWPRYIVDEAIIFLLCGFFFLSTSLSICLSFFRLISIMNLL